MKPVFGGLLCSGAQATALRQRRSGDSALAMANGLVLVLQ